MRLLGVWQRLPVIMRAVVVGSIVAIIGTGPWAIFVAANFKYFPSLPWSVVVTGPYLWLFWRYFQGKGWPRSTSEARRTNLRARALSEAVWGWSLLAGMVGLAALVAFQRVLARLVAFPQEPLPHVSNMSTLALLAMLLMSAAVAGLTEEAAFRGYMQGPIERRHGPVIAILVSGALFGIAHFTHPGVGFALLPYYWAISLVYGMLAYLTGSILPGVVLHATGNVFGGISLLMNGQSWTQSSPTPAALIWESGADSSFWWSCLVAALLVLAAVWAYRGLAREVRSEIKSLFDCDICSVPSRPLCLPGPLQSRLRPSPRSGV
jgi:membrane protease YdiL (CAAX protease family)